MIQPPLFCPTMYLFRRFFCLVCLLASVPAFGGKALSWPAQVIQQQGETFTSCVRQVQQKGIGGLRVW